MVMASQLNVIITTKDVKFENFTTVSSVTTLGNISKVGILVYHKSDDSAQSIIDALRSTQISQLLYLCAEEDIKDEVKVFVQGSDGSVITDDFYLSSAEAFASLSNDVSRSTELMSTNSVEALGDFLNRLSSGKVNFSKPYLSTIESATKKLNLGYLQKENELQTAVKTAVAMFETVSKDLDAAKRTNESLVKQADEARQMIEHSSGTLSGDGSGSTQVYRFATVAYKKRKKAIQIKEIGNVPYLMSFSLGLMEYLARVQRDKTRIIIVLPVGENYETMYGDKMPAGIDFIVKGNHNQRSRYMSPITYTNYPVVSVMNSLLSDDYDSYVILDRSNTSVKPILRPEPGQEKLRTYYAVQSARTFEKFPTVKKNMSITGINHVPGTLFTIPVIEEYSAKKMKRIDTYRETCSDVYEKMIGIR